MYNSIDNIFKAFCLSVINRFFSIFRRSPTLKNEKKIFRATAHVCRSSPPDAMPFRLVNIF